MEIQHEQEERQVARAFERRRYSDEGRRFRAALRELFQRAGEARREIYRKAWEHSPASAVEILRDDPWRFGRLTGNSNPFATPGVAEAASWYVERALGRSRYDLREAAALSRDAAAVLDARRRIRLDRRKVADVAGKLRDVRRRRTEAAFAMRLVVDAAAYVYVDPRGALRAMLSAHRRGVPWEIATTLRRSPESYGVLHGQDRRGGFGFLRSGSERHARASACGLAALIDRVIRECWYRPKAGEVLGKREWLRLVRSILAHTRDVHGFAASEPIGPLLSDAKRLLSAIRPSSASEAPVQRRIAAMVAGPALAYATRICREIEVEPRAVVAGGRLSTAPPAKDEATRGCPISGLPRVRFCTVVGASCVVGLHLGDRLHRGSHERVDAAHEQGDRDHEALNPRARLCVLGPWRTSQPASPAPASSSRSIPMAPRRSLAATRPPSSRLAITMACMSASTWSRSLSPSSSASTRARRAISAGSASSSAAVLNSATNAGTAASAAAESGPSS